MKCMLLIKKKNMKNMLLLVSLLFAFCTVGCKTSSRPDGKPAEAPYVAPTLPFEVPTGTAALIKLRPDAFDKSVEFLTTSEGKSLLDLPESMTSHGLFLGTLLSYDGSANLMHLVSSSGAMFPGLDPERAALLAVSVAGNEEMLKHLELNSPADLSSDIPRGLFLRLYLPAKDPAQLATWVKSQCDALRFACDQDFHLSAGSDHVLIDYRVGNMMEVVMASRLEKGQTLPESPRPMPDTTFIEQSTAALHVFTNNDAAFGIYLRAEALADLGALFGMTEAFRALQYATPETRSMLYHTGYELAGMTYTMLSPQTREVSDSTLLARSSEGAVQLDAVFGYTDRGRAISESIGEREKLSTVSGGSMLTMDLNPQWSSARERAVVPPWLDISNDEQRARAVEILRTGGIWSYLIPAHNYPYGFARGSENLASGIDMKIDSIRAAFDIVPSTQGPLPLSLQGGFIIGLSPDSDPQEAKTFLGYIFNAQLNLHATLEVSEDKSHPEVRVLFGEGMASAPEAIGPDGLAQLDLERISRTFAELGAPPEFVGLLTSLQRIRYRNARTNTASHHQMRVGGKDFAKLSIAARPAPRLAAARHPDCLLPLIEASQQARAFTTRGVRMEWEMYSSLLEALEQAEQSCEEASSDLMAMRGRWEQWLGVQKLRNFEVEEARASLSRACNLGAKTSCDLARKLPEIASWVHLTKVSVAITEDEQRSDSKPGLILSPAGFSRLGGIGMSGMEEPQMLAMEGFDWGEIEDQERVAQFISFSSKERILIQPLVEARHAAILANFTRAPGAQRVKRELELLRVEPLLEVMVRDRTDQARTLSFQPARGDAHELHIKLGKSGMTWVSKGKVVPAIEGCKKVTICPEGDLETLIERARGAEGAARDKASSDVVDALQMQMVDEVLNPEKTPATILISVDETIPFIALAELAARIQARTSHTVTFELGSAWVEGMPE